MIDRLNKGLPLLLIITLVLMWELIVRWSDIPHYILPAPSRVLSTIFTQADILFQETCYTGLEAALGLVVGVSAAIFLGVFASRFFPRRKNCDANSYSCEGNSNSRNRSAICNLVRIWYDSADPNSRSSHIFPNVD